MMLKTRNFKKQNNIFVFQKRINEKESSFSFLLYFTSLCQPTESFGLPLAGTSARRGPREVPPPPVGVGEPIVNSTTRSAPKVKAFSKWIFNCVSVLKKLAVMLNFSKSS